MYKEYLPIQINRIQNHNHTSQYQESIWSLLVLFLNVPLVSCSGDGGEIHIIRKYQINQGTGK